MGHVITIASSKGGVGKTTVAVNLAAGLADRARYDHPDEPFRVLLVDLDPSCDALVTIANQNGFQTSSGKSLYALLKTQPPPSPQPLMRVSDFHPNLWYIPSNRDRMKFLARDELSTLPRREERLVRALRPILSSFEFIIIDTPASSTSTYLFANAFLASTGVIIPVETGSLAVGGMQDLISEINKYGGSLEHAIPILGIIPTKVPKRGVVPLGLEQELGKRYAKLILPANHQSLMVDRSFFEHKDLFAQTPNYWERRNLTPANDEDTSPVGEFGDIIMELLARLGYEI